MSRSRVYVFSFALLVCLFVSVVLALASTLLRKDQGISARLDVIQNILSVAGYTKEKIDILLQKDSQEVIQLFRREFQVRLVNRNNNEVSLDWVKKELFLLGYKNEEIDEKEAFELIEIFQSKISLLASVVQKKPSEYDPGLNFIFLYKPQEKVISYIVPVEGYGLWGMIFGYVALEPDLLTIKDIRFYKHQETPGLGGECSEPWFTNMFKGKKILNSQGNFVSVSVVKGKAEELYSGLDLQHYVDGISGGTITSRGITNFLKEDLGRYNRYFKTIRENISSQ